MPNHVTNKIVFDASEAERVFSAVCPDGKFDFELLVPSPLNLYQGGLSSEESKDFPLNWDTWNQPNWGTKWNCYDQSCGIEKGEAFIKFDTAWSVPYPVIAAFCNKFKMPFVHRYFDEGHNFWGIEIWSDHKQWGDRVMDIGYVARIRKSYSNPGEKRALCMELKGYDPEAEDDENER